MTLSDSWTKGAVQARDDGIEVTVRNARDPGQGCLHIDREAWRCFISALNEGEFRPPFRPAQEAA